MTGSLEFYRLEKTYQIIKSSKDTLMLIGIHHQRMKWMLQHHLHIHGMHEHSTSMSMPPERPVQQNTAVYSRVTIGLFCTVNIR